MSYLKNCKGSLKYSTLSNLFMNKLGMNSI